MYVCRIKYKWLSYYALLYAEKKLHYDNDKNHWWCLKQFKSKLKDYVYDSVERAYHENEPINSMWGQHNNVYL